MSDFLIDSVLGVAAENAIRELLSHPENRLKLYSLIPDRLAAFESVSDVKSQKSGIDLLGEQVSPVRLSIKSRRELAWKLHCKHDLLVEVRHRWMDMPPGVAFSSRVPWLGWLYDTKADVIIYCGYEKSLIYPVYMLNWCKWKPWVLENLESFPENDTSKEGGTRMNGGAYCTFNRFVPISRIPPSMYAVIAASSHKLP